MQKEFFQTMQDFVFEASEIAVSHFYNSKPSLKADRSVVTVADKKISRLAHCQLNKYFSDSKHILVEEEDPNVKNYLNPDTLKKAKYIWSVDPIDGTRNYANQMPQFGISIGLMKDLKPWMGFVYFPILKEAFFHNGSKAYFVQGFGTKKKRIKVIKPVHVPVSNQTYFLCVDTFFKKFRWDHKDCRVMIQSCAVVELCWPAVARGCAGMIKSSLWDFAGSWPIVHAAGLQLRSLKTGKELDRIDLDVFDPKLPWRLKDFYIISDKKNFSIIQNKISLLHSTMTA